MNLLKLLTDNLRHRHHANRLAAGRIPAWFGLEYMEQRLQLSGEICGQVFDDLDGDGEQDAGETGLAAVRVYLDANANGSYDVGEIDALTNSSPAGAYGINGLADGYYHLSVELPAGYTCVDPVGGEYAVTISGGSLADFCDFALQASSTGSGEICGEVYEDTDGDGVQDAGESGLDGLTVYLDDNGNGVFDAGENAVLTNTSPLGAYGFNALADGSYTVRVDVPSGYVLTDPATGAYSVTISGGSLADFRDFGLQPMPTGEICGQVFEDLNGDGVQDAAETGISGVRLFLDDNGNGLFDAGETETLSNTSPVGAYAFEHLSDGNYTVAAELPSGYQLTTPVGGSHAVNITGGSLADFQDFGMEPIAAACESESTDESDAGPERPWQKWGLKRPWTQEDSLLGNLMIRHAPGLDGSHRFGLLTARSLQDDPVGLPVQIAKLPDELNRRI